MADLKKTIDIILNGEDRASRPMRGVTKAMRGLKTSFGAIAKTGAAAGAAIAAVSASVTALAGAGLKKAYDQSVDFETAMVDLEKVLGNQPEKLDQAKKAAMNLSNQYGVSSTEIVDSMANWKQAGYDAEEAAALAEETISLMYVSELDAAQATKALTQMMKGFGVETEDARSKVDAINEISNNYATSVGHLTDALARAAPEASAVGLSMEELAAIMTPAIEKFQDGRRVGTAFKTMLTKIQSDSKPVRQALEELGVSQKDANGELRSGKDILYDVGEAFQTLEPNQKAFIAAQIAGREHSGKFLATMNSWDQVSQTYETAMGSAGSATEELQAKLDSAEKQLDRWNTAWENLAVVIGDQYRDATTEAVKGGTDLVNAITESINKGDFDELFSVITTSAEDLSATLSGIAEALPDALEGVDWSPLADGLEDIKDSISGLFDGLDLTKTDDLQRAIQMVVDTLGSLETGAAGTITTIEGLGQTLVTFINNVNAGFEFFGDTLDWVTVGIDSLYGAAVQASQALIGLIDLIPGMDLSGVQQDLQRLQDAADRDSIERLNSIFDKGAQSADNFKTSVASAGDTTKDTQVQADNLADAINGIPADKKTDVNVDDNGSAQRTKEEIREAVRDKTQYVNVDDKGSAQDTKEKIDKTIPDEKQLEIQADIRKQELERDIASIEAAAETMQTKMEWQAKVDIAEAEASMEKFKSAIGSVNTGIKSTGDAISSLVGEMTGADSFSDKMQIERWVEKEQERRQQEFELQKDLITEQIALAKEKKSAMESGEGLIQIESSGLEPEIEAFMWRILEKIQVRANEETSEFLLGI